MVIPREAGRITYSANIRDMKRIALDEKQKAVIVGALLGDAYLEQNWSKTNSRIGIRHSREQEKYVQWTYEVLKPLVLTPPQYYDRTHSVWFRTISHPELTELHNVFYQGRKKIIPQTIANYLSNPLTMATWFMDDGNAFRESKGAKARGYHLNTQSFTLAENRLLQSAFSSAWDIRPTIQQNHGYPRLYIGAQYLDRFREIVEPHIHPTLAYKIG